MQFEDFRISHDGLMCTVTVTVVFPTGGWSNPKLTLTVPDVPPEDGVQELALTATRPSPGIQVTQGFERWPDPVSLTFERPDWFKGVRIVNASGDQPGTIFLAMSEDFDIFPL